MSRQDGSRRPFAERALVLVMRAYPSRFRELLAEDLLEVFRSESNRIREDRGAWAAAAFGMRTVLAAIVGAQFEWRRPATVGPVRPPRADSGASGWLDALRFEGTLARRALGRSPGFAAIVVLTLGLGIGANAAMFELVDRLLLRPPAFLANAEEVHQLHYARTNRGTRFSTGAFSYPALASIAEGVSGVETVVGYASRERIAQFGGRPRKVRVLAGSGAFWDLFSAPPALGRFFGAAEDRLPAGEPVAVLSYALWRSAFGGAPDAIGKTLIVADRPRTVIGVAPRGFHGMDLGSPDLFVPLSAAGASFIGDTFMSSAGTTWIRIVARIPGAARAPVVAELSSRLAAHYADYAGDDAAREMNVVAELQPLLDDRGPDPRAASKIALWLLGMSGVMVLVACANVATLMLRRALERRRDVAVRTALGIPAARLLLQPLLESLALSVLVAIAAVPIGHQAVGFITRMLLPDVATTVSGLSLRSILYGVAVVLIAGFVSALVPALQNRRADISSLMRSGGARSGRTRSLVQSFLPALQAALCAVLLVGAGLFVRSVQEIGRIDLGFDPTRVLTVTAETSGAFDSFGPDDRAFGFSMEELRDRASTVPGVAEAALALATPFGNRNNAGLTLSDGNRAPQGSYELNLVDAAYFRAVGTRVVAGRGFGRSDVRGAPPVMMVSESLARTVWPGQPALGKCVHVGVGVENACNEVVGVVEDVRSQDMAEQAPLQFYLPRTQVDRTMRETIVVRTGTRADAVLEPLRRELQAAVPASVFVRLESLDRRVRDETRNWRVGARVFTAFGGLSLIIAGIGLFSVVAYDVAQRKAEFGVRVALGARPFDLVRLVLRNGLRLSATGVVAGLAGAALLVRWLDGLLFNVSPHDPLTFACVGLLLVASALAASWIPTAQARRVDVQTVLREE